MANIWIQICIFIPTTTNSKESYYLISPHLGFQPTLFGSIGISQLTLLIVMLIVADAVMTNCGCKEMTLKNLFVRKWPLNPPYFGALCRLKHCMISETQDARVASIYGYCVPLPFMMIMHWWILGKPCIRRSKRKLWWTLVSVCSFFVPSICR